MRDKRAQQDTSENCIIVQKNTEDQHELTQKKLLGAFYTPNETALCMSKWTIRADNEIILEPSFGSGIFISSIISICESNNYPNITIHGVEIDRKTFDNLTPGESNKILLHQEDFIDTIPFKVDAVIGNPPYVRLRNLTQEQRENALSTSKDILKCNMDTSGSLWMPFVLHSMKFLNLGGRLAFVLPYEMTYVKYSKPLWQALCDNFGSIRITRTFERIFPDILQDVIILYADEFGKNTPFIQYDIFETIEKMTKNEPSNKRKININEILSGNRVFLESLLHPDLCMLLKRIEKKLVESKELVKFNIGYVSGDKEFFHPEQQDILTFNLSHDNLIPSVTTSRTLKGIGLATSSIPPDKISYLFHPKPNKLSMKELAYIRKGEFEGVNKRYKCAIRDPWYIVPGVKIPKVILSVFSECPILILNDNEYAASNSLLCGYTNNVTAEDIAARWYSSLTLLQCEIEIHSLGGGVMILIPGEVDNIKLIKNLEYTKDHLDKINTHLKNNEITEAYSQGDILLVNELGLSTQEIDMIKNGIKTLKRWRTSSRSYSPTKSKEQ